MKSTWLHLPPRRPAVTLTFDLQDLIKSWVGVSKYSLSVLSKLFKAFLRCRDNYICPDEQMYMADGQSKNIMPSSTLSGGESIQTLKETHNTEPNPWPGLVLSLTTTGPWSYWHGSVHASSLSPVPCYVYTKQQSSQLLSDTHVHQRSDTATLLLTCQCQLNRFHLWWTIICAWSALFPSQSGTLHAAAGYLGHHRCCHCPEQVTPFSIADTVLTSLTFTSLLSPLLCIIVFLIVMYF